MLSPSSGTTNPYQINPGNASKLALKWTFHTHGAVPVTPTVEPGGLYVPDWAGYIYKLNPATGQLIWSNNLINYSGVWGSMSRSSPAIGDSIIVIGDGYAHDSGNTNNPGARVYGINKSNGSLAWQTVVDKTSQWSEILGSPVIHNGIVYVGVASWEESLATSSSFVPSFRGSVVALNASNGAILWQFYTTPPGYTGAAVPGTNPVIWWGNSSLIVATGNNYSLPNSVGKCVGAAYPSVSNMTACLDPTDYVESILSLDLKTGRLLWSRRMSGPDTWTEACNSSNAAVEAANCKFGPSYDFDFASQPNITWVPNFSGVPDDRGGTSGGNILGAGQKSGVYWGLNPNNGGLFWSANIGRGGIEWGSAVNADNGNYVYVALNNFLHYSNTLVGTGKGSISSNGGAWTSLNLKTGKIAWQIPAYGNDLVTPGYPGASPGAMAFTNNVTFAASKSGYMTAVDANTGSILWKYPAGVEIDSGAAIFNETVYWGVGYHAAPASGAPGVYAFSVSGH